jgi:hypothetical protein
MKMSYARKEVYALANAEFSETELTYLTSANRLDQRLEQVRRRLSLDPTGAKERGRGGGLVTISSRRLHARRDDE